MTKKEKEIRSEWAEFRRKNNKIKKIELKTEDISKIFSKMFGQEVHFMAKATTVGAVGVDLKLKFEKLHYLEDDKCGC